MDTSERVEEAPMTTEATDRVESIRARLEARTQGKWQHVTSAPFGFVASTGQDQDNKNHYVEPVVQDYRHDGARFDAEFIALAPADIAWLLADRERMIAESAGKDETIALAIKRYAKVMVDAERLAADAERWRTYMRNQFGDDPKILAMATENFDKGNELHASRVARSATEGSAETRDAARWRAIRPFLGVKHMFDAGRLGVPAFYVQRLHISGAEITHPDSAAARRAPTITPEELVDGLSPVAVEPPSVPRSPVSDEGLDNDDKGKTMKNQTQAPQTRE